jgi:peptidoglycan/LPS O-acetylase OafA/YrhL
MLSLCPKRELGTEAKIVSAGRRSRYNRGMSDEARKQAWLGAAGSFLLGATQLLFAATDRSWWKALCGAFLLSIGIVLLVLDRRPSRRTTGMSKRDVKLLCMIGFAIGLIGYAFIVLFQDYYGHAPSSRTTVIVGAVLSVVAWPFLWRIVRGNLRSRGLYNGGQAPDSLPTSE